MLEAVGESKVGHDHVPVSVEEQILEFEVTMDNLFLMKVPDSRNELSKQLASVAFFEVAVGEDVVEEFAAGGIFENDPDVFVRFDHIVEMDDIRVVQCLQQFDHQKTFSEMKGIVTDLEDLDFACNLTHTNSRIDTTSTDELYGHFFAPLIMQAELDFAKLALAKGLEEQIGPKLWNSAIWVGRSIGKCSGVLLDIKGGLGSGRRFLVVRVV